MKEQLIAPRHLEIHHYFLGFIMIMYGIIKVSIGCLALFMPSKQREWTANHPQLKYVIAKDTTLAAQVIEVALIIFGIYSFMNALDLLKIYPMAFLNTRMFLYTFYTLIGILLIIFYSLVIYTNLPIPKVKTEISRYKLIGLIGGMLFLIMTPLYIVVHQIQDHSFRTAFVTKGLVTWSALFCVAFLVAATVVITIDVYKTHTKHKPVNIRDLVALVFIPLGWT